MPEDRNFARLKGIKKKYGSTIAYSVDFLYNFTSFIAVGRKLPKATLSIGKPFDLSYKGFAAEKTKKEIFRNVISYISLTKHTIISRYFAGTARKMVGMLETPFCSQLLAFSALEHIIEKEQGKLKNLFLLKKKKKQTNSRIILSSIKMHLK